MKSNPAGGVFVDNKHHGIPYRNPEGYPDPTAYAALNKAQGEMDDDCMRVQQFIRSLKTIVDQSGYDLLARIEIRDRRTGRCYR